MLKLVEISATDKAVIQTALVAINKASTKLNGAFYRGTGQIKSTVLSKIRTRKLMTNNIVGK
jgi:hypothetical protein